MCEQIVKASGEIRRNESALGVVQRRAACFDNACLQVLQKVGDALKRRFFAVQCIRGVAPVDAVLAVRRLRLRQLQCACCCNRIVRWSKNATARRQLLLYLGQIALSGRHAGGAAIEKEIGADAHDRLSLISAQRKE
jgi:hypothetical protein